MHVKARVTRNTYTHIRARARCSASRFGMRERDIERALVREVRRAGGEAYKWVSPGNDGVPDRIVILGGEVIFVELKAETGRLSAVQKLQIDRLRKMGQEVVVVKGMKSLEEFFLDRGYVRNAERIRDGIHSA